MDYCNAPMVGLGENDTYDPVCELFKGHEGRHKSRRAAGDWKLSAADVRDALHIERLRQEELDSDAGK